MFSIRATTFTKPTYPSLSPAKILMVISLSFLARLLVYFAYYGLWPNQTMTGQETFLHINVLLKTKTQCRRLAIVLRAIVAPSADNKRFGVRFCFTAHISGSLKNKIDCDANRDLFARTGSAPLGSVPRNGTPREGKIMSNTTATCL